MNQITIENSRSRCPIASTLDILGDKWSLVLVRDMIGGNKRFGEFLESPEGIPTNILANRLKKLEACGLVIKQAYQTRPPRFEYLLTARGRALHPVLQEICRWANAHIEGTWIPPERFKFRTD